MENKSWIDIGKDISDSVQDAINSGDLNHLSRDISNSLKDASSKLGQTFTNYANKGYVYDQEEIVVYSEKSVRALEKKERKSNKRFKSDIGFGIFFLIVFILEILDDFEFEFEILVIAVVCFGIGAYRRSQANHLEKKLIAFSTVRLAFDDREQVSIQELSRLMNLNSPEAISLLQEMSRDGLFTQAHMDTRRNMFYLTDRAFMNGMRNPNAEQQEVEPQETMAEELDYVSMIHHYNDLIEDEKVSRQLDDMETIVNRIMEYVEMHPESENDIRRMMKYYLPTTMKLLDAYSKFDGVQTENIQKSKKEIEDSLDMINSAFAQLFDQMYQDTTLDISSDISVLENLFNQDGLKEKV